MSDHVPIKCPHLAEMHHVLGKKKRVRLHEVRLGVLMFTLVRKEGSVFNYITYPSWKGRCLITDDKATSPFLQHRYLTVVFTLDHLSYFPPTTLPLSQSHRHIPP